MIFFSNGNKIKDLASHDSYKFFLQSLIIIDEVNCIYFNQL